MDGWKRKKVKHLGMVYSGSTPSTDQPEYWNGSIEWITPNDLSKNKDKYFQNCERKISRAGLKYSSAILLPAGSLVISSRAPIGYLTIPVSGFTTNQGCKSIIFNSDNDVEFQYYNFQFNVERLKQIGEGTTFSEVSKKFLENFELDTPVFKTEQIKIAKILTTIDESISETNAVIKKHQCILTGLMQDLLTKGIDEHSNIRSEKANNFIVRRGLKVPEDWNVITLKECVRPNTVITYGIVQTGPDLPEGIQVLRTLDLKADRINTKNLLKTTPEISSTYSRTILEGGDIVCNVRASVGDFNIVPEELAGINISRGVARISPRKGIDNIFLLWFLKSEANKKQMELLIKGTTFIDINIKDLREIAVPIPKSINEQLLIGSILEENLKALKDEQSYLAKLESLKTGLMQDLLTGKVKVPESILKPVN